MSASDCPQVSFFLPLVPSAMSGKDLEEKRVMSHGYGACACSQREVPPMTKHQSRKAFKARLLRRLVFSTILILVAVRLFVGPLVVPVNIWRWKPARKHHAPIQSDEDWDKVSLLCPVLL